MRTDTPFKQMKDHRSVHSQLGWSKGSFDTCIMPINSHLDSLRQTCIDHNLLCGVGSRQWKNPPDVSKIAYSSAILKEIAVSCLSWFITGLLIKFQLHMVHAIEDAIVCRLFF